MICCFDLKSLTWKHHRWLLKDFGIHWTKFGIEMRNQGRPFVRVYPPAKRLIAFWGRKPTGRPNNSFSPLCLLATFTVVAYLNGSKVMTSLEMRQSELPPSGNEQPPPPPPTTVDHQQTSFAFETAHHSGSKDFGVQRLGLLISRFMDRQRENLLGPRPSTRFGNKHTIQRRNCRVSNLEFHKRHLINSKITLFSARVPLSTGVLRLQGLKTWVSSPDTQKQRGWLAGWMAGWLIC